MVVPTAADCAQTVLIYVGEGKGTRSSDHSLWHHSGSCATYYFTARKQTLVAVSSGGMRKRLPSV